MSNEPLQGGPYPPSSNAVNVPGDIQAVVNWAAPKAVMTFASAAARTAAFTAAAISPAAGMLCHRADAPGTNKYEYYNATAGAWRVHGPYQDSNTLAATAASVTFSAIPTYLHTITVTSTASCTGGSGAVTLQLRVNADSATNYNGQHQVMTNTSTNATNAAAQTSARIGAMAIGVIKWSASTADIAGWSNPHTGVNLTYQGQMFDTAASSFVEWGGWSYTGAGPYTSITLFPSAGSFITGSQFTITGFE